MTTETLQGTSANDSIAGTSRSEVILGLAGNDTIHGGAGDDTLDGGGGFDTALFSSTYAANSIAQSESGLVTVSGPDGVDVLQNVEYLRFSDATVRLVIASNPPESRVNTTVTGNQASPVVATLPDGGWLVTWQSSGQDGSSWGIYQQRFSAEGVAMGGETRVNSRTVNSQESPSVSVLADGGWIVTWQSEGQDESGWGVYQQRFASGGGRVGTETRVNGTSPDHQWLGNSAALADGGWIVTWTASNQDGEGTGIYGRRFGSDGAPMGGEFLVNSYTASNQEYSTATNLEDGGWLILWSSHSQDGSGWGVFGQRFNADGSRLSAEFLVNARTENEQYRPVVSALSSGGWVAVWEAGEGDGQGGWGIVGQRFDVDGKRTGPEFVVNSFANNNQTDLALTPLADGGWVVAWQSDGQDGSGWGVYGQRFAANGARVGHEFRVNTTSKENQWAPSVSALADGGFIVTWSASGQDGSGYGVYQKRFDASGEEYGGLATAQNDTVLGSPQGDLIHGGRGVDLIEGGPGDDTLIGGPGIDLLSGGAGNDLFVMERAEFAIGRTTDSDIIDGGDGIDTLTVDLGPEYYSGFSLLGQSVRNLENIVVANPYYGPAYFSATQVSALSSLLFTSVLGRAQWFNVHVVGDGGDAVLSAIDPRSTIGSLNLTGTYRDIDASDLVLEAASSSGTPAMLSVSTFRSIRLGAGDDLLTIDSRSSGRSVTVDGGEGVDTLIVSGGQFFDLTAATIAGVETLRHGDLAVLVTDTQATSLNFEGEGRLYVRTGNIVSGTSEADVYDGLGNAYAFRGGRGDDTVSNVDTVILTGNYADYDFVWNGSQLRIAHVRGTLADGTDTLQYVSNIRFADTTLRIDDAPDVASFFTGSDPGALGRFRTLARVDYDKRFWGQRNNTADTDVFSSSFEPNSPIAFAASSTNNDGWVAAFFDARTGQRLEFQAQVGGAIYPYYADWMGTGNWLPGISTPSGFVPYGGGDVVFTMQVGGPIQGYALTIELRDDYAGNTDTFGRMDPQVGLLRGYVGDVGDEDWIRTSLVAGTRYEFRLSGQPSGGGTLVDPRLMLRDEQGLLLETASETVSGVAGGDDVLLFRPSVSGDYYLTVSDVGKLYKGSWTLTQQSLDVVPGNVSSTDRVDWGSGRTFSISNEINTLSDHDWFRVWLDKGVTYNFRMLGAATGETLNDPQLSLRSITGILLAQDDNGGNVTDARLVFSAPESGWYFLDAGASGNASKGTYKLAGSALADDYSNDLLTTGIVAQDAPVRGLVSYIDDSDWFKVALSAGRTYVIDLKGDAGAGAQLDPLADPLLIVRDSTGAVVGRHDDFGGGLDARAYFTPTADGIHFLEARSAYRFDVGAYEIGFARAPADDFQDLPGPNASALTPGAPIDGTIGVPGDRDMFKVSLEPGRVYQIGASGMAGHAGTLVNPHIRVFGASGSLLDFDDNGGLGNDALLYFVAPSAGTHYVEVSSSDRGGMGTYRVSIVQRDVPADDVPDDVSTQVYLTPGQRFAGNLLTHGDQDWFRIPLEVGKDYVFKVLASTSGSGSLLDPVLEIRSPDGAQYSRIDNSLLSREPGISFRPDAGGGWFLGVRAADGATDTGTYTLVTRPPDDHASAREGATTIIPGQSVSGAIQWNDGGWGVRARDSIGTATDFDEDWFRFEAAAGQVLSVQASVADGSSLSRPMVEVVDALGRSLAVGDGLETADGLAVAAFKAPAAGTYHARIIDGAGATGEYRLTLAAGDLSDEDGAGAVTMAFDGSGDVRVAKAYGRIGLSGDADHYEVLLEAGHHYRIETIAVRDGVHAPLGSALLSIDWLAQGASTAEPVEVAHEVARPSQFESALHFAPTDGRLTIGLAPADPTQTGSYALRVVDLGGTVDDQRPDRTTEYDDLADGVLAAGDSLRGKIDAAEDIDLFAINLSAGNVYDFSVKGFVDGLGTLAKGQLALLDADGRLVTAGRFDELTGRADLAVSVFASGRHYLAVSAVEVIGNVGTYSLDTHLRGADALGATDDIRADTRSGAVVAPGRPVAGRIDHAGDTDWIRAMLEAGKVYVIDVLAAGDGAGGSLLDSRLSLRDGTGSEIAFDDDAGAGLDSHLMFSPGATDNYYLEVGGNDGVTGSYTLRVRELYSGIADPLRAAQWHLDALRIPLLGGEITGAGVTVGMIDDGIESHHPDLTQQIDRALSYDTDFDVRDGRHKRPPGLPYDKHGTPVAGIIVGQANNETGIVGVAPDSEIASVRSVYYTGTLPALGLQWQVDVSNNSWIWGGAFSDNFNSTAMVSGWQSLRKGVEDGRGGLGTVFVFSAGNGASYGDDTNLHNFQNAREVISVGAANPDGSPIWFTSPGATVLVGSYGVSVLTTDRLGELGYNELGDYTFFGGTSAAAPVVSGVVALMLEANPGLGYRDVQQILAYSAVHPDNQAWKVNGASDWNLGGLRFNDSLGFGLVDAYTAVSLARTWGVTRTAQDEVVASARAFGLDLAIPDGDGASLSRTFRIDSGVRVERVELGIDLRHTRLGDLIVELTSPSGTVSTLLNRPTVSEERPFGLTGPESGLPEHLVWDLGSVQFWGEAAAGDWRVTIRDVRAEETGSLASLSLRVYGAPDDGDDIYVFTDEGFSGVTPRRLADDGGTDTINASPMLHDTYVDLAAGLIAALGVTHRIADWTTIEKAITGAGDDRLEGNSSDNLLRAGAGNDLLAGGGGDDTLEGGAGRDLARYPGRIAEYAVSWNPDARALTVVDNLKANGDDGTDLLTGIERLVFADGEMTLGPTQGNRAPLANASLFEQTVVVGIGLGILFDLPADAFTDPDASSGDTLEITVSSPDGGELPSWLSYDPGTGKFAGVPPEDLQTQINVLVTATDDFGATASDVLVFQLGDNQAPVVTVPFELVVSEDAALVSLGLAAPFDPEGSEVSVEILELPGIGDIVSKSGLPIVVGQRITADELSELHYRTARDANGNAGDLRYEAVDDDGVSARSSVHLFVSAVNDAPRFPSAGSALVIDYPAQSSVTLDVQRPTDPESPITSVRVTALPVVGVVELDGQPIQVDRLLTLDQLSRLSFKLSENVNGPIGALTIQAVDPQGLAADWNLAISVSGETGSDVGTLGNDPMYGSIGDDTLAGLAGDDTMIGNAGNDRLLGGIGHDLLFGGSGNDMLDGSTGNDVLDGGTGNDTMAGGPGSDSYFVDSLRDVVLEVIPGGAGGKDIVQTTVPLTAGANIESLVAAAGHAINLTGNALDNVLVGNELDNLLSGANGRDTLSGGAGSDTLDGGLGIDRLSGGVGDDVFFVDSRSDTVVELAGEGHDRVFAKTTFTLPSNVEDLFLEEGEGWNAGGNSLPNRLRGNSGDNLLSGGIGSDTLEGGLGNDVYVLSDTLDLIIDTGGVDSIRSVLDIRLPAGIENGELVGIGDAAATGNSLDNLLIGNAGENLLEGGAGVDTLIGGAGADQFMVVNNGARLVPDAIGDFVSGEDLLLIDLASFAWSALSPDVISSGTVSPGSFVKGAGASALDPNDHWVLDTAQNLLLFDYDGSGAAAPIPLVRFIGAIDPDFGGSDIYIAV